MDPVTFSTLTVLLAAHVTPACEAPPESAVVFWIGVREAAPGETVQLRPSWTSAPGSFDPVRAECVTGLTLSEPTLGRPAADGAALRIADSAPHGALLKIRASVGGRPFEGEIRVVDPRRAPLAATWRQTPFACEAHPQDPPLVPIGELVFTADGRFSVTWTPFESYKDYWGSYRYDAGSGAVELTVESGNNVPPDLDLKGEARVGADGRLRFSGIALGQPNGPPPPAGCALEFVR